MSNLRLLKYASETLVAAAVGLAGFVYFAADTAFAEGEKPAAVSFTDVVIADRFWAPRIETNRTVTIPSVFKKCEQTGRIENFEIAAGVKKGAFRGGLPFNDTDPYKIIEGASYSLSLHPDASLDKYLDELIAKIAAAQEPDGYLYTGRTIDPNGPVKWMGPERWSNLRMSHELYNSGHLYEAAAAHYQATGKRSLLNVATKNADLLVATFGPDKKRSVPGHQVVEIGLVKLYQATGSEKYLELAKFFLDERGRAHGRELYGAYSQDHKPIIEQDEAVGHAVRATYMYAGIADLAALTDNADYVRAIGRIWENVVSKKLYLTGGVGALHKGEAFGEDYELPNASAYNETCAAIGNAMWNHRLFLLHAEAKYIDVLERILYNGFLAGVSLGGEEFFYPNPLEADGKYKFNQGAAIRQPWFNCSCCPTNVVRFLPSLGQSVYAVAGDNLYVNLFIAGTGTCKLKDNTVKLRQRTQYPWDGDIRIDVESERAAEFTVRVRIPGWARGEPVPSDLYRYADEAKGKVTLKVNDKPVSVDMEKGFARIRRVWKNGDNIRLELPMAVRRVICNEKVKDNIGKAALERGPIVYCAEGADNGGNALNLVLPDDATLKTAYRKDLLGGVYVITGKAMALRPGADGKVLPGRQDFVAIPYYAWAHRGAGEMAVWLPRTVEAASTRAESTSPVERRN